MIPGASVTLEASATNDSTAEQSTQTSVTYRWELLEGDRTLDLDGPNPLLPLTAPARPQSVSMRVFASSNELESAPAQFTIEVAPQDPAATPDVSPHETITTHMANNILLDALALLDPSATVPSAFEWQQTVGEKVTTVEESGGQFIRFDAPAQTTELAFSVFGTSDSSGVTIQSEPAVIRLQVKQDSENTAPDVLLCASTLTPAPGAQVILAASVTDPEQDPVGILMWDSDDLGVAITRDQSGANTLEDICAGATSAAHATTQLATFAAPAGLTTFSVSLQICDNLAACGDASLQMQTQ